MPIVEPAPTGKILPPVKTVAYRADRIVPKVMHVTSDLLAPRFESPLKRFGGPYDGASANGWHVCLRQDDGTLESLSGPHETVTEATVALARLIGGEPL